MEKDTALAMARKIMLDFAARTGLSPAVAHPRRYLWADAFAVCNFLELYRRSGDDTFKGLALALVEQVHDILGRHRQDDPRRGWISGLHAAERLQGLVAENPALFAGHGRLSGLLAQLLGYKPLAAAIERFWLAERDQEAETWSEHREINTVMLATSLAPDGFLRICGK